MDGLDDRAVETICQRSLDADHDRRLIVIHSPRRARKDAHDRARQITELRARLARIARPAAQRNRGTASFLDFPDGTVQLNADKVAAASCWDGLRGIMIWGCDATDPRTLIDQYRKLATIEACFRTYRHDLKIRPIFHWREPRIRARIAICYMASCCLQHRLALRGHPLIPEHIRRVLNALQISLLHDPHGDQRIGLPSAITADAQEIYRTLGLHWRRRPFLMEPRSPLPEP